LTGELIPEENVADAEAELLDCLKAVPGVRWEVEKVLPDSNRGTI